MEINSNVDNPSSIIESEEMESKSVSNGVTNHNSSNKPEKKLEMKNKSKKRSKKDDCQPLPKKPSKADNSESWKMRTISGIDVTSRPAVVSHGGKFIFVTSREKILIYSATSGQLVRSLNTGRVLAVQKTDQEHEIVVAHKKKVEVWDFMQIKVIRELKIYSKEIYSYEKGLESIYIPERFYEDHEIFLTVYGKQKSSLFRVNLLTKSLSRIFQNIRAGSVHTGEKDNLVCAISDHREKGYKDATLLVYDKNIAKNMSFHADKERPFTVAQLHPEKRVLVVGDTSGRILVYSGEYQPGEGWSELCWFSAGLEQQEPSKAILHWHSLPVSSLCWSEGGEVLYSGGGEAVLVKWRQEDGSQPSFLPRLGGAITGLAGGGGVTVAQLENNRLVVVDRITDTTITCLAGLARNTAGYPAGLSTVSSLNQLVFNGGPGHVQVFRLGSDTVTSLDITQQNTLAKERNNSPLNSEVECLAVSPGGDYMATVDCLWASLSRILLKFWVWSPQANNYSLNTQVEFPHLRGVKSMCFQPSSSDSPPTSPPMLLTVGCDSKAKLWQFDGSSWSCASCLTFRQRAVESGDWSCDGSMLGLAFAHTATLWSSSSSDLRTSLGLHNDQENITSLAFGRNSTAKYLHVSTASKLVVWDLISLNPSWVLSLSPSSSPYSRVIPAPHLDLLALVQKEKIQLVSALSKTVVAQFHNTNCTGGAAWSHDSLYFLSYDGSLATITRDRPRLVKQQALMKKSSSVVPWLQNKTSPETVQQPLSRARTCRDIESLLTLPLHTLPPTHQLQQTLVR